jgi:hypothetical protein
MPPSTAWLCTGVAEKKIARGVVASLEPEEVAPHDKKKIYKNKSF